MNVQGTKRVLDERTSNQQQPFFKTNLFKERTKKFVALLTMEKRKKGYK